jgi:dTDP-4-dehydrorhamnose reductase
MENVLILGSKGMLGGQLMKLFKNSIGWDRQDVNVLEFNVLKKKISELPSVPKAIINCVAFNDVDGAELNLEFASELNELFVGNLAALAKQLDVPVVHFSSNYVFDGEKGEYTENDAPRPISVYGQTKRGGELALIAGTEKYYLIRTAVLFGPKGESEMSKKSFLELMLGLAEKTDTIKAVQDEINSMTLVTDLAQVVQKILEGQMPFGIYHIVNSGEASWYDFAKEIFAIIGKKVSVTPVPSTEFPRKASRPKRAVLINTKFLPLRPWQEALRSYLQNN